MAVDAAEQEREQLNTGTKEVAESHRFDEARLAAWMQAHVEGFEGPEEVVLVRLLVVATVFMLVTFHGVLMI